jgi:hypothetical protein
LVRAFRFYHASVSLQAIKTPLYAILVAMLNGKQSGFVSDVLTTVQQAFAQGVKEGDWIGSVLRVGVCDGSNGSSASSCC